MMKTFWRVDPPPTGRYKSFERRGWPTCFYADESPCAMILCEDQYIPADVATGAHAELVVYVAQYTRGKTGFDWRRLKARAKALAEAKTIVQRFIETHPHFRPDYEEIVTYQQELFEEQKEER